MSTKVLVRYEQESWGKLIKDSYETYIDKKRTIAHIKSALYSDPHVTKVEVIKLEDN